LDGWENVLKKADIIINLAGENISALRWNSKKKERILNSRIQTTKILIQALEANDFNPDCFVQVSGIHFYGSWNERIVDESAPAGDGFLAEVSQAVEALSENIEARGIRRIVIRLGPVWSSRGGIFSKITLPFRSFVGGQSGSGRQWMSWIHRQDFCRALDFVISQPDLSGPVNLTSSQPVQNREMTRILGKLLKRPTFFRIPAWAIKFLLGEMGEELLLSNQRVYPKYLVDSGFEFDFPSIEAAISDLLVKS
jgi:uncharacterized protein (TIGR01777 family)